MHRLKNFDLNYFVRSVDESAVVSQSHFHVDEVAPITTNGWIDGLPAVVFLIRQASRSAGKSLNISIGIKLIRRPSDFNLDEIKKITDEMPPFVTLGGGAWAMAGIAYHRKSDIEVNQEIIEGFIAFIQDFEDDWGDRQIYLFLWDKGASQP